MMSDYHSALLKLFVLLCGVFGITSTLALPVDSTSNSLPLGALVPKIVGKINEVGFKLTPEGNGYKLTLFKPDRTFRQEEVTLIDNKELSVKGHSQEHFGLYFYKSEYVADGHGYRGKYSLVPARATPVPLPAQTLKSSAG